MRIPGLSRALILADRTMDYIPFVGIINNVVDVALRAILWLVPKEKKENVHYFRHLDQKGLGASVLYAVPFLGTVVKIVQFFSANSKLEAKTFKNKEEMHSAADAGNTSAMAALAEVYENTDTDEALFWLIKAADAGDEESIGLLVGYYQVENQHVKALTYAKKLSLDKLTEFGQACMALKGDVLPEKDKELGLACWDYAISQGSEEAKTALENFRQSRLA